jgi:hypothetical protein
MKFFYGVALIYRKKGVSERVNKNEKIHALIAYLQVLTQVSKCDVCVYNEMRRTIKKLEELLDE